MRRVAKTTVFALLCAAAFLLNKKALYEGVSRDVPLFEEKLGGVFGFAIILAVLIVFYWRVDVYRQRHNDCSLSIPKKVLAALFAFFMIFGESYWIGDTWDYAVGNWTVRLFCALFAVGYSYFFCQLFCAVHAAGAKLARLMRVPVAECTSSDERQPRRIRAVRFVFEKHPMLCCMGIMLVCWAIYMAAFYPAILSPDPSFQIRQFFNVDTKYAQGVILIDESVKMTNHHPVAHTVLLGGCVKLGKAIGNDNFGLFVYSMIQTLVLSAALSATICMLKKLRVPTAMRAVLLGIYALVPVFPFYAMSAVKDTLFTSFMIFYLILTVDILCFYRAQKLRVRQLVCLLIVGLLLCLFRNNGLYVIVLSMPFLAVWLRRNKKACAGVLAAFAGVIVLSTAYTKVLLPAFGISPGSIREVLSVPFQQTARYVKEHADELTAHEKEVIDGILGIEDLAERYDPEFADTVKNEFNKYTTTDDLKEYFSVWLNGLLKHPDTYIQATMNNVYGYFYPGATNWYIYHNFDKRITKDHLVDYSYLEQTEGLRDVLTAYGVIFPYIPVIGWLCNIGFNTLVLLYLTVTLLERREMRRYLPAMLPMLATLLICVASPVNTYFRYAMPYVFAMPMMTLAFWRLLHPAAHDETVVMLSHKNPTVISM